MIIYDPPTAEATRQEWEDYLYSLDPITDKVEFDRVNAFIDLRFSRGFNLVDLLPI